MKRRIFSSGPGLVQMKADGKTAEILIYDEIGEDWYGGLGAKEFVQQLAGLGDVDVINVRINSPGGNVFDGVAIYNALKQHPATINVQIDALAASIATVIAMAGDTVTIAETAMMMVHNPWVLTMGEASDLRKTADLLDQMRDGMMMAAYKRTKIGTDGLKAIMDAETWYTAEQAVEAGWADSLTAVPENKAEAMAKYDLSAFKNAPKPSDFEAKRAEIAEKQRIEAEEAAAIEWAVISASLRQESLRLAEL